MSAWITRFADAERGGPALRVGVKDLIDMVGHPTTNGSRAIAAAAAPAGADAACMSGLRAAEQQGRAVIVGKTNLHELAFGVTGINPWFGTPVNPLDPLRPPGGSSSGSAVAVAVGDADVCYGSDTGGSIRIPAACCGVAGLKTTFGRIPLDGVLPLAPSLDTVGPMARDVGGLVEGMRLLEPGFEVAPRPAARIGRLRLPAAAWIDAAIDAALDGFDVVDVDLPGWEQATMATMLVLGAEAWAVHRHLFDEHAALLAPDVASRLATSATITPGQVDSARAVAGSWSNEVEAAFAAVEVIALPVLADEPPSLVESARLTEIRYVSPMNLAGVPALAMPVRPVASTGSSWAAAGFPASLQLFGPRGSEEALLATGLAVEAARQ